MMVESVIVDATISLYAGAKIMELLFPKIPPTLTIAAAALIAGIYISFGGLGAVVINDALQATLIILGGVLTLWLAWAAIPSWDAVVEAASDGALNLFQPADNAQLPWPSIFTGLLVFLYVAGIQFAFGCALLIAGSLLTAPPPQDKVDKHIFRREIVWRDREHFAKLAWYQDHRIISSALAVIATGFLVRWW